MGKVKGLWEDEQNRRYNELIKYFMNNGYTREKAEEMSAEDVKAEFEGPFEE